MSKIEVSAKDIQKLKEKTDNLDKKIKDQVNELHQKLDERITKLMNLLRTDERIPKLDTNLKELDKRVDQKIEDLILIFDQKLEEQVDTLNQKLDKNFANFEDSITKIEESIEAMNKNISLNFDNFETEIKTQAEINVSIRDELNAKMNKTISRIDTELEEIKSQQDIAKISKGSLEKQMIEKAQSMISTEVRMACKHKEEEILMNVWLDELKDIIKNVDKLKAKDPKDIKLQINEIAKTIEVFREKLK